MNEEIYEQMIDDILKSVSEEYRPISENDRAEYFNLGAKHERKNIAFEVMNIVNSYKKTYTKKEIKR